MTATAQQPAPPTKSGGTPRCSTCGLELPVRTQLGAQKLRMECVGCGAQLLAVIDRNAPAELLANVRIQPQKGDPAPNGKSPPAPPPRQTPPPPPTALTRAFDSLLDDPPPMRVAVEGRPLAAFVQDHGASAYDPELAQEFTSRFNASTAEVEAVVESVERGGPIDSDTHRGIAHESLAQATRDIDLFVKLGVEPSGGGYPGRHSMRVAMLSAAMGARLGWDRQTLVELSVGCLIHDLGMMLVPGKSFLRGEALDDREFEKIAAHPLHTFELIEEHLPETPVATRMVAYQVHERNDGSGYPRQRKSPRIHDASKVAAVADVFIALTSPRPHRDPLPPYLAIKHLLRETAAGRFDPAATRALLKAVSLFPIGSCLELSDGRVARVLRTNAHDYCRPVVETWRRGELDAPPRIVDLAVQPEQTLSVKRAMRDLDER